MNARVKTTIRRLALLAGLTLALVSLTGSSATAAPQTIDLCAVPGTATLTGSVTVPIWGFALNPGSCAGATAVLPGPMLDVHEGDAVTINVTNALPAGHTLAFEIAGIDFAPGPSEAAVGATVTRSFTASAPGTYLYSSAGSAGRQQAMGLYGALIVRSNTTGQAYDTATSAYDAEATLVLGAVDPAFSAAPDTFDLTNYEAAYWLINGKAYPDTAPVAAGAGTRVLLRYLNGGFDNTSMALLGMHQRVLARDAILLGNPFDATVEIIPAGATEDSIALVPSSAPPSANGFALFNRNLHVTNAPCAPSTSCAAGGMLTFVQP